MTGNVKSALISGASRGIGLGVATRLAQQGFSLTITARDAARLDVVAAELRAAGATEVTPVVADMSDSSDIERLLEQHADRYGTLSTLILNAGVGTAGRLRTRRYAASTKLSL